MKTLFCLLILLEPIVLHAQLDSFPTCLDNPIWGYYSQGGHLTSPVFRMYGLLGDTLINTENYSKIYSLSDTIPEESSIENFLGGLRVFEEKVYYFNMFTSKEEILYDFSLSINDTVIFNDSGDYGVVYDIDSVLIHGTVHKRFYLENSNYGRGEWIENIGSIHGLLVSMTYPTENNPPTTTLVCFKYQDINYYPNYNCGCFDNYMSPLFINKKTNENKLSIYPNPAENILHIQFTEGVESMQVFDICGRCIKSNTLNSSGDIQIDISSLSPGTYLVKVISNNRQDCFIFFKY